MLRALTSAFATRSEPNPWQSAPAGCRLPVAGCRPKGIHPEAIEKGPQRKSAGLLHCTSALNGSAAVVRRLEPEQSLPDKNFVERNRHLRRCRAPAAADIEPESMRGAAQHMGIAIATGHGGTRMRAAVLQGIELAFDIQQQDALATRREDQLSPARRQIPHGAGGQQCSIRRRCCRQHGHAPWRAAALRAPQRPSPAGAG